MEEDIKILETLKESYIKASECGLGYPSDNREDKRTAQAIENMLNRNKELEEKWDKDTHKLQNALDLANADKINNYIPVSLVEETIEELNRKIKYEDNEKVIIYLHKQRKILQELLEKRK